jgi:hypothetical protein
MGYMVILGNYGQGISTQPKHNSHQDLKYSKNRRVVDMNS